MHHEVHIGCHVGREQGAVKTSTVQAHLSGKVLTGPVLNNTFKVICQCQLTELSSVRATG